MAFPVLTTVRLRLRPVEVSDFSKLHDIRQHPEVVKYITGKLASREESWRRTLFSIGHWHAQGYGFWILEDLASGTFIGEVGLMECRRDMSPSLDGSIETGWALLPAFHRQGFAREALTAVLAWGDATLDCRRYSCIISPENEASLGLARQLGFRESAKTFYQGDEVLILMRER